MLRYRLALLMGLAACAGCGWMIPDDRDVPDGVRRDVQQMTNDFVAMPGQGCDVLLDRLRRVATELDDEGESTGGGGGGCEQPAGFDADGLW